MAYKDKSIPQKGDVVLGTVLGHNAKGRVKSVRDDGRTLIITRCGQAVKHKSGQMIQGPIQELEVEAEDFELVFRKGG